MLDERAVSICHRQDIIEIVIMDMFRFCPELLEVRARVVAVLNDAGYQWLSHYSSVDPVHDVYGVEVCGIFDEDDAKAIHRLLQKMFPAWRRGYWLYKDWGIEPGFIALVCRDDEPSDERWQTA